MRVAALCVGLATCLPAGARAQDAAREIPEERLARIEHEARGSRDCGEPELIAAIALYRPAPGGALRDRLSGYIDSAALARLACRGEIGFGARVVPRARPMPTAAEVRARAEPLLARAREPGHCVELARAVEELLEALEQRARHEPTAAASLTVLTTLGDEEVGRLDRCERARSLPPELGSVRIVVVGERRRDAAVHTALDAVVPELLILYRETLLDAPTSSGELELSVRVGADGRVEPQRVVRDRGLDHHVSLAIWRLLGTITLPTHRRELHLRVELTPRAPQQGSTSISAR